MIIILMINRVRNCIKYITVASSTNEFELSEN